jgi:hypothetical protein
MKANPAATKPPTVLSFSPKPFAAVAKPGSCKMRLLRHVRNTVPTFDDTHTYAHTCNTAYTTPPHRIHTYSYIQSIEIDHIHKHARDDISYLACKRYGTIRLRLRCDPRDAKRCDERRLDEKDDPDEVVVVVVLRSEQQA